MWKIGIYVENRNKVPTWLCPPNRHHGPCSSPEPCDIQKTNLSPDQEKVLEAPRMGSCIWDTVLGVLYLGYSPWGFPGEGNSQWEPLNMGASQKPNKPLLINSCGCWVVRGHRGLGGAGGGRRSRLTAEANGEEWEG